MLLARRGFMSYRTACDAKATLPKWRGVTDVKPRVTRRNVTTRWSHTASAARKSELPIVDLTFERRASRIAPGRLVRKPDADSELLQCVLVGRSFPTCYCGNANDFSDCT